MLRRSHIGVLRTVHLSVLLSAFLLTTLTPHAQRLLTLEEAVATALQNNYDIQLSRNDSIVAALDYSYRNVVFLPTIIGAAGTSRTRNDQKLKFVKRSGGGDSAVNRDAVQTSNINYSANLNWILFDGLKMFTTRDKAIEFLKLG